MDAEEFWTILHAMPESDPVFWRLYHNEQGEPLIYSMENLPGTYIDVDPETFAINDMNVRVYDGKLIKIKPKTIIKKLEPSDTGTACYPSNVAIIVDETEPHQRWKIKTYEYD